MKYSIQKSRHSSVKFTYEKGVKDYRSTPVELEFWARIQELEKQISLRDGLLEEDYALKRLLSQEYQDIKKDRDMWKASV